MTTSATSQAIATVEQFKSALLAVRDKNMPSTHLDMLRAQCRATNSTITSTKLAEAAGYQNYNAANLQYGTLANKVAESLGFSPAARADGSLMWWTTLSYSDEGIGEHETGQFQFVMRPELAQALREMRWA